MAKGRSVADRTSPPSSPDSGSGQVEGGGRIDLVLLDVGGPIYDDGAYRDALLRATRELVAERQEQAGRGSAVSSEAQVQDAQVQEAPVQEAEFQEVYDRQRQAQAGSLRTAVAEHFLSPDDRAELSERAKSYWFYPPSALHDDVLPALRELAAQHRIAVVANQRSLVVDALRRDGVAEHVDVWAISEVVGAEKPAPEIFEHALREAGVAPENAVHVGNRLDTDVRGAHRVGIRAVWVLRGEAPPAPTPEQLAEPDATISGLDELPAALAKLRGPA